MANVLEILKEPNKVLRSKARPVPVAEITGRKIRELILRMKETLKNTPDGVGLAAPQVGESLRIFIVSEEAEEIDRLEKMLHKKAVGEKDSPDVNQPQKREWKYYAFINPAVKKSSKRRLERPEGCLSVPGKFGAVKRHEKITVEAYDEYGKKFTRGYSRFFAKVIQHELDHLQGTLFIDKAEKIFSDKSRT